MKLDKELVMIDLDSESKEEALTLLGNQLFDKGFVKENFVESIIERERTFPTGLPTAPFGVAIPHADSDKVNEPQIAFASLKKPVKFSVMGNSDEKIDVRVIFMLALKDPDDQLEMLQKLIGLFQDQETVTKLANIKSTDTLNELIGDRTHQSLN
ncbi:PTS sugar transporter subunit IIA [Virgibacillus litoralis]|uniref:PTS system galactitol-specific IIA component n=1 Tax=Virgibacillus litoralis TaxID=578221 RepID=A0ABS4HC19_9BACI|nr:PTS sugar transporter subunit IIA [Virgibacillus litoralis]MBP1948393.1 PTS system galactitol-specific IIA component [Virgibacillus litoralis]